MLANNCDFVSMRENFDTSTPFGKAMIGILAVFAQLEREQITERMQMGKDARAKMGLFHGSGNIPIGYSYEDGQLVIQEFEALQVRKIFEMYASGLGYAKIADALNEAGLKHRYGDWSRKTVRYAIQNKIYVGMIPHRGKWYKGIHEPIVSQELWDRVESLKTKKADAKRQINPINGKSTSLLAGLLVCGHCGARYTLTGHTHKTIKEGKKRYRKYECNSRLKRKECLVIDSNCMNKIWTMEILDQIIIDEVCKLELVPDEFFENQRKSTKTEIEPIMRQIAQIDEQISRLIDLYSVGQMPHNVIQDKINALSVQRDKLEIEVSSAEQEQGKSLSNDVIRENVRSFSKLAKIGKIDDLKPILFLLIEKIVLDDEDVIIHWNF